MVEHKKTIIQQQNNKGFCFSILIYFTKIHNSGIRIIHLQKRVYSVLLKNCGELCTVLAIEWLTEYEFDAL